MKVFTQEELDAWEQKKESDIERILPDSKLHLFDCEDNESLEEEKEKFNNPIDVQMDILAKAKLYLDYQMRSEIRNQGKLSNSSLNWMRNVVGMTAGLQTQMYGTKSMNLNLTANEVSHSQIAQKLREMKHDK